MSERTHSGQKDIASIGEKWRGWATIASAVIALLVLVFGGGFIYNEIWKSKVLTYTILPTYDLGGQTFSGLVIENRGRVNLTDVQVVLADLGVPIQTINMPGVHEPAQIVDGGVGEKTARIQIPRLSQGANITIYIVTTGRVTLQEKKTFVVSSNETIGIDSSSQLLVPLLVLSAFALLGGVSFGVFMGLVLLGRIQFSITRG